ncbi:hypothetical protein MK079_03315 [Candidatus Gracilibacteria bacterium]|nr:hypothetical protein [Candidatus Gracilibacteria bacterium]
MFKMEGTFELRPLNMRHLKDFFGNDYDLRNYLSHNFESLLVHLAHLAMSIHDIKPQSIYLEVEMCDIFQEVWETLQQKDFPIQVQIKINKQTKKQTKKPTKEGGLFHYCVLGEHKNLFKKVNEDKEVNLYLIHKQGYKNAYTLNFLSYVFENLRPEDRDNYSILQCIQKYHNANVYWEYLNLFQNNLPLSNKMIVDISQTSLLSGIMDHRQRLGGGHYRLNRKELTEIETFSEAFNISRQKLYSILPSSAPLLFLPSTQDINKWYVILGEHGYGFTHIGTFKRSTKTKVTF